MPIALITGMTGFTGQYVARDLVSRGYQVVGLDQSSGADPFSFSDKIADIYRCNLLDRTSVARVVNLIQPDVVIHLAAIAFVAHGDVDAIYRINIVGTRNLLEALAGLHHSPKSVLLASSANVYGNTSVSPINESVVPNPANDYAVSKLAMENMARLWMDRLPITIVRPFNYTGVGQSLNFLLPKIVDHFRRGAQEIELGNIDVARDFSDVRMVSDAYCKLVEKAPAGEIFNVCSGNAYSLKKILNLMSVIAGYEIKVIENPAFARAGEIKFLCGNGSKLNSYLSGLHSISLVDTLRWMFFINS